MKRNRRPKPVWQGTGGDRVGSGAILLPDPRADRHSSKAGICRGATLNNNPNATARLLLLPDAPDANGCPRIAVAIPAPRGPRLIVYASLSLALAALRAMGDAA